MRKWPKQGFLNSYFGDRWERLRYTFNAQLPDYVDLAAAWPALDDVKIIHYEKYKPWKPYPPELEPVMSLWHEALRFEQTNNVKPEDDEDEGV